MALWGNIILNFLMAPINALFPFVQYLQKHLPLFQRGKTSILPQYLEETFQIILMVCSIITNCTTTVVLPTTLQ